MWNSFLELIALALNSLHSVTQDYGFAIILLTIAMRIALMPLTIKQTQSMHELQRIQPKIKELQDKHKNDKEKLQEETLKFYQENKVNPFGGCLPLLLQMPVFIGLFRVLGGTEQKPGLLMKYLAANPAVHKNFWIVLPDITKTPQWVWQHQGVVAALPYVALGLLFALSVWLPQQLGPGDPQQKRIGAYMSLMMLYFGWISPAGVLVYWVTSSAWQIGQQAVTLRLMDRRNADKDGAAAQPASGGGKAKKSKKSEGERKS